MPAKAARDTQSGPADSERWQLSRGAQRLGGAFAECAVRRRRSWTAYGGRLKSNRVKFGLGARETRAPQVEPKAAHLVAPETGRAAARGAFLGRVSSHPIVSPSLTWACLSAGALSLSLSLARSLEILFALPDSCAS